MRKSLAIVICASLLVVLVTPTIIITHSTPKFFQLSKNKMAIVIDQDENQAIETLSHATQQASLQADSYPQAELQHQTTAQSVQSHSTTQQENEAMGGILGVPKDTKQQTGQYQANEPIEVPQQQSPPSEASSQGIASLPAASSQSIPTTPEAVSALSSDTQTPEVQNSPISAQQQPPVSVQDSNQNSQVVEVPLPSPSTTYSGAKVGSSSPLRIGLANPSSPTPMLYVSNAKTTEPTEPTIEVLPKETQVASSTEFSTPITGYPMVISSKPTLLASEPSTTATSSVPAKEESVKQDTPVETKQPLLVSTLKSAETAQTPAQTVQQGSLTVEPTPMLTSSYSILDSTNSEPQVTSTLKETSQPAKINKVSRSIVSEPPSSSLSSQSNPSASSNRAVATTQKASLSRSTGPTLASLMSFSSYPTEVSDLSVQVPPLGGDSGVVAGTSK